MSQQSTWAVVIIIQAVAEILTLTIHIIESNPGFASVTNISGAQKLTPLLIRHLDELHYVSIVPFKEQAMAFNVICNNQPLQLATGCCRTTNNDETIAVATRKRNNEFRNKQNRAVQAKRSENIEKKNKENLKGGHLIDAKNSDHIRELNRQASAKSKKNNPLHVREVNRNAQNTNRFLMSGLNPGDHGLLQPATKRASCTPVNEIQESKLNVKILYRRYKKWQKSLKLSMITLSVVLNMFVLAVINIMVSFICQKV